MKKTSLMMALLLMLCLCPLEVLANVQFSVSIDGPDKIFTKDYVTYAIRIEGDCDYVTNEWRLGGACVGRGKNYQLTAQSNPGTMTLSCVTKVDDGHGSSITLTSAKSITVVAPEISVVREGYNRNSLSQNRPPIKENMSDSGTALIHKNGMQVATDRMNLLIAISPVDVDVQNFEISLSEPEIVKLYKGNSSFELPYRPVNSMVKAETINQRLTNLKINGEQCYENLTVNIVINGDVKLSLAYGVYGIQNDDFNVASEEMGSIKSLFPNLVDNEWACVENSESQHYNCIAYAVNRNEFWVKRVLDEYLSVNPANFLSYFTVQNNLYMTSMDAFGDNNRIFETSDIISFFTSPFWGSHAASAVTLSISNSKILYYDNFHGARRSARTEGCFAGWHMFESKLGSGPIIIHRAEQICGQKYGQIQIKFE